MSAGLSKESVLVKASLVLQLLLTNGQQLGIVGQPTFAQSGSQGNFNLSVSVSQQDIMTNVQLKLMSLILEELQSIKDRQTTGSLKTVLNSPTGHQGVILVQQHYGGTNFFNRFWEEFKFEFGDVTGNYWIGNERLHQLTREGRYKLRVDLEAKNNSQWYWAEYKTFRVWDESTQYRLEIGGYSGTAGDSMAFVNGMKFSTRDRDNDVHTTHHCCQDYANNGGFWYKDCFRASVNSAPSGQHGFEWFHLPIGSDWPEKKLLSSRFILLLK